MMRIRLPRWRITGLAGEVAAQELLSRGRHDDLEAVYRAAEQLREEHLRREPDAPSPVDRFASRSVMIMLGAAGLVIAIAGLKAVASIVTPVFLALNLVVVAYPMQSWLVRRRVPRSLAAVLVCITIFVSLVAFFWSIGWALALLVEKLPAYNGKFVQLYDLGLRQLHRGGITEEQIFESAKKVDPNRITDVAAVILDQLQGSLTLVGIMVTAVLFILMDSVGFERRVRIATEHHPSLFLAIDSFTHGVRKYWMVTTVFGLIIAALDVGALWALGVPLALVWGLLSFVTNYIPNVGFVIGVIPPALLALLESGPIKALLVVVAYWVLNFVVQSLIQPKVAGDAIGVTATVSFVSLVFWAYVLGFAGALVALPATLLVKAILVDGDPEARWVNILIAADPSTALPDDAEEPEEADPDVTPEGETASDDVVAARAEDVTEGDTVDKAVDRVLGEGPA